MSTPKGGSEMRGFRFPGPFVPGECPACHADLRYVVDGHVFTSAIGLVDPKSDHVQTWQCPRCGATWPRWKPYEERVGG